MRYGAVNKAHVRVGKERFMACFKHSIRPEFDSRTISAASAHPYSEAQRDE